MTTKTTKPEEQTAGNIYTRLAAINKGITAIGKNRKNEQQGFKFRGIDDVMNELHALFAENEVIVLPNCGEPIITERTNSKGTVIFSVRIPIEFEFISSDGTSVRCNVVGEAMDSGDKGMNKAMSIALKYALLQMFLIPTEEPKDPDAEAHEVKPKAAHPAKPAGKPKLSAEQFHRVLARIQAGERTVLANAIATFDLIPVQLQALTEAHNAIKEEIQS